MVVFGFFRTDQLSSEDEVRSRTAAAAEELFDGVSVGGGAAMAAIRCGATEADLRAEGGAGTGRTGPPPLGASGVRRNDPADPGGATRTLAERGPFPALLLLYR